MNNSGKEFVLLLSGRSKIDNYEENILLAKLNLKSGIIARKASAYRVALEYIETDLESKRTVPFDC